jgi:F-type H+-transporting ATPase subunit a
LGQGRGDMVEHEAWFTAVLNKLFGGVVTTVLMKLAEIPHLAFVRPQDPLHPIPNYVAGEILVTLIIVVGVLIVRSRLSMANPGKLQQMLEVFLQFTQNMTDEMIGHGGRRYVPMIGTLGLFVLLCNLQGLIPTLITPTASIQVTLGCAVVAFLYYNFHAFRERGILGYLRHLCGPLAAMGVIMFPVEIFSNLLRMLSLSVRLWANMLVGGLLVFVFTSLIPVAIPSVFMGLHIMEAFLQAYVFMILPALYIGLALSEEH